MRCHYEVLGVTETATEDDLKKAYKKLALQWHPGSFGSMFRWLWTSDCLDKNPTQIAEAQRRFLEIRAAYEVLSDSRERAWYDAHRDVMLQKASGDDYQDDTINIYPFFTSSCYQGYNDSDTVSTLNSINASPLVSLQGFYTIYQQLFKDIAEQDLKGSTDKTIVIPEFGNSTSDYEEVSVAKDFLRERRSIL